MGTKLSNAELKSIQDALLSAVVNYDELQRLVRYSLGESLNHIANESKTLPSQVFDLLVWLNSRGRTLELVDAAIAEYPENPEIQELEGELRHYKRTRPSKTKDQYFDISGIIPGKSVYGDVIQVFGVPPKWDSADGKPVANYPDRGLMITFTGPTRENPRVDLVTLGRSFVGELPHGIQMNMGGSQLTDALAGTFEIDEDLCLPGRTAYQPIAGGEGNSITVILREGRISTLYISAT